MPVSFVLNIDLLTLWPTVPEYYHKQSGSEFKRCMYEHEEQDWVLRPACVIHTRGAHFFHIQFLGGSINFHREKNASDKLTKAIAVYG